MMDAWSFLAKGHLSEAGNLGPTKHQANVTENDPFSDYLPTQVLEKCLDFVW